jgi:hypothetical protein
MKDDGPEDKPASSVSQQQKDSAKYILDNVRIPEDLSAATNYMRHRRCGECPLGLGCPSRGRTKYKNGKSRGATACEHTDPTEFHVDLLRCPNPKCGE